MGTRLPCMTREWSAANLTPLSVIWTCILFVKLIDLRSWYKGLVELATARKRGGPWAEVPSMMVAGG